MIDLYCGICDTVWNKHPVAPGRLACISPVYGASKKTKQENRVSVTEEVEAVIQDSGAFCDGPDDRLSFTAALTRQLYHAEKYNYLDRIEAIASYDLLIDEKWVGGRRYKKRWSEVEAESAVDETIAAAKFLTSQQLNKKLVLSAQGVTVAQYRRATQAMCDLTRPDDILGLGGWCIAGRKRAQILPAFYLIMENIIPLASKYFSRVHIWGVVLAEALGPLLWLCDQYGLKLSTDSVGPQLKPAAFGTWGYAEWRNPKYKKAPVETRGLDRALHVKKTREWLANFRNTQWYRPMYTYRYYPVNNKFQGRLF